MSSAKISLDADDWPRLSSSDFDMDRELLDYNHVRTLNLHGLSCFVSSTRGDIIALPLDSLLTHAE